MNMNLMNKLIQSVKVIHFDDLDNAQLLHESQDGNFYTVSYGDAQMTLCYPDDLIGELKDREDDTLVPLIEELATIPDDVFVALNG